MAEGVGFEPTKRVTPLTRFPGVRTRPDCAIPPGVSEVSSTATSPDQTSAQAGTIAAAVLGGALEVP